MTSRRAADLLAIEMACVMRASGMEKELSTGRWVKVSEECDRNCAECPLVQRSEELLDMYELMLTKMIDETEKEEAETKELKDWQRNCDPWQPLVI